ncbi:MAG: hypothetical protein A2078_02715 [Nitrospirae bacterium GWC2_57_9]|nr:MAG: hypothetical protein A2078_02715 [Nitrospirae bacterium GWC2_57_9]
MKKIICFMASLLLMTGTARAAEEVPAAPARAAEASLLTLKVPLFSPLFARVPVAKVNDEQITVEELEKALGMMHAGRTTESPGTRKDYAKVLQRLVTARLIVQEAEAMGMDGLAEVREPVSKFRETALRELLRYELVRDVKADEAEVERVYRMSSKEYRIRSLMFRTEADARAMAKAVEAGGGFEELARQARANKTARGQGDVETVRASELNSAIAAELANMKAGMVSRPVPVQPGFVLFKLEEERTVESAEAREAARQQVLTKKKHEALIEHNKKLSGKYLTFNMKRIESIDFAAPQTSMEKLLRDKRVLVQIKGERPVTVADLATVLDQQLYHGSKNAAKKKMNNRKRDVLEELVAKRLLLAEALRRGIDRTEEFKNKMKDYEDNLLFGLFVERVIKPDVKPTEEELKTYYEKHRNDYLLAAKVRFESLAFTGEKEAADALNKLKAGTELRWLRENAPGRAAAEEGTLLYSGDFVSIDELPASLREALADAHPGEFKLAGLPDGTAYVLAVQETKAPEPIPFQQLEEQIGQKLSEENIRKVLDTWTDKLKEGTEVTLYLTTAP